MPIVAGLSSNFGLKDPFGLYSGTAGLKPAAEGPTTAGSADPRLPAGMRNNNPGNIKFRSDVAWEGLVGPSENLDQGDPQAVFDTPEKGMRAAYKLALNKYKDGKRTAKDLIAGDGGWTPGNSQAAANIARSMGLGPDDDLRLDDPAQAKSFLRALVTQEHGSASSAYTDDMITGTISGLHAEKPPFDKVLDDGVAGDPSAKGLARLAPPEKEIARGKGGALSFAHEGQDDLQPEFRAILADTSSAMGRDFLITSGYRSPSHPVEAAKEKPGEHSRHHASDISMKGMDEAERTRLVLELQARGAKRFGIYKNLPDMLHVDMRDQLGDGSSWFMYDKTNRKLGQAPGWFQDVAAGKAGALTAKSVARGSVAVDAGFKISDPMGLYGGKSPFPTIQAVPEEAPATESEPVQPDPADAQLKELDAQQPGRFKAIPADQYEVWKADWEERNRSTGIVGDTKKLLRSGLDSTAMALREGIGMIPGAGPVAVAAIDEIDAWARGDGVSSEQFLQRSAEQSRAGLTPGMKEASEKSWWDSERMRPGPAWTDPRSYYAGLVESLPSTVATMGPSMALARASFTRALAAGATEKAAAAAAAKTATVSGAVLEGFIGGGQSASSVRQQIMSMPRQALEQSEAVQSLMADGLTFDQAVTAVADDAATRAFVIGGVATGAFGGFGDRAIASIVAEGVGGGILKRVLGGGGRGAVAEGALEEAPQSAAQQVAENAAMQTVDPDRDLTEGVAEAAAGGLAVGGVMGGGMGAAAGAARPAPVTDTAPAVEPPPAPTKGPLKRALEYGERRAVEKRTFVVDDPAYQELPAGELHGQTVALSPDQANVPAGMHRVVGDDGVPRIMGERLLKESQTPALPERGIEAGMREGLPPIGATVRVEADGIPAFMARVESHADGEIVVFDAASGEVYQVPPEAVTTMAGKGIPSVLDQPGQQDLTGEDITTPAAPIAAETKTELPPREEQKPAAEAFPGPPAPGQRVIVDAPGIERFSGRVERYEQDGDTTEAIVVNEAGTPMQVPLDALYVSKLTDSQVEQQELERNPPVAREPIGKDVPLARPIGDKTVMLPDEKHARLYDLGVNRRTSQKLAGVSSLDRDRVTPAEQQKLADAFGVSALAMGQMADDYRYRVERAGKQARSQLPVNMHPVNERRLKQWQSEHRRSQAQQGEGSDLAAWWDGELTALERKAALEKAGVKRSEKLKWSSMTPQIRERLAAQRTPEGDSVDQTAPELVETPIPVVEKPIPVDAKTDGSAAVDAAALEAATSPTNATPEPTDAQKEAGNYKKGHVRIGGLDVSIENPVGSERKGKTKTGKEWSVKMKSHYGYIRGTVGRDKDHLDVFIRPGTAELADDAPVFVVDQVDPGRSVFDEHKIMLGFNTEDEARVGYLANYSRGWKGLKTITPTTLGEFKRWLAAGNTKRPFARRSDDRSGPERGADQIHREMADRIAAKDLVADADTSRQTAAVIDPKGRIWALKATTNPAGDHAEFFGRLIEENAVPHDRTGYVRVTTYSGQIGASGDGDANESQRKTLASLKAAAARAGISYLDGSTPKETTPERNVAEPAKPAAESAPTWGASNKLVTSDRAEEVRKRLREKLRGQLSAGIDPEVLALGAELAAFHIEAGARRFAEFAKAVAADMGTSVEKLRPFLRAWYNAARDLMEDSGVDIAGMDDADTVRAELARLKEDGPGHEPEQLDRPGARPLEGTPSEAIRRPAGSRDAGAQPARGGQADLFGGEPAGGERIPAGRGVADGAGDVPAVAAGGQRADTPVDAVASDGAGDAERSARDADRVEYPASAATPAALRPVDYAITDADELGAGGAKTKFRNNVAAIRTLRQVEAEARTATRDEQSILAKWVGWGGLRAAFFREDGTVAKGWEKEAAELKELLTADEYRAAEASTRNAHYTSPEVVNAIWGMVRRLGFTGGQVLEPSVGAGNFIGLMPGEWRTAAKVTGVELDTITGGIAKNLYPAANIITPVGFQNVTVPDNHFDLAIGNPPFGSERLYDPDRRRLNKFSIHNFFFAKSVESLRPNGILAMVVTNYFLDAADARARAYIAARADLVAAIRLPNNAFMKNAGTEVTTDIIVLRKRDEGAPASTVDWVESSTWKDKEGREVPLNRYFKKHPEMMLGEFGAYGTMYRDNEAALIARDDDDLEQLLRSATLRLPEGIMDRPGTEAPPPMETVPETAADAMVGSLFEDNGRVFIRKPDVLGQPQAEAVTIAGDTARERVTGMIRVRDAFTRLRRAQIDDGATDDAIGELRTSLNRDYDAFVKRHGPINADANRRLFRDDPTWPQIAALEENFDKGISAAVAKSTGETPRAPSARKAAIFTKRTQQPYRRPTSASSAKDALATVLADLGRVDLDAMSGLYRKSPAQIVDELGPLLFRTPTGAYVTADHYLSGNVKQKLAEAQRAAEADPELRRNVAALRDAIPADIEPVDINVKPGAPWVPAKHIAAFVDAITEVSGAKAFWSAANAKWATDVAKRPTEAASAQWGTDRASVTHVLDAVLNGQTIKIYDHHRDGTSTLNQPATDAANEKAERVKAEWTRWLWDDDARRDELARLYNDTFNTDVLRKFDGSHLTLPGKVSDDIITFRPHQKNFVWRALQSATTLADHVVGAGKTFALIAAAMEMRRTGKARKPLFVVPNHLVGQWAADFVKLYPGAKVLATTKKDFDAENRKKLVARIATGDWDAVIVAHSSFGRIGVDPEFEEKFIRNQIDELEASIIALRRETGEKSRNVAQLSKWRENMEGKLKRLLDAGAKDHGLTFNELGIDALFVDEAHEFKNLSFPTSMTRVAGLGNPAGSQKAADLYMKDLAVQEQTGGNIVFATGTPLSNTMAEMYTVQRYLDGQALKDLGVAHFDAWARVFGEVVTDWELSPSGQYKLNSRFAKFVNMPELMQRYLSFADVITNDDIRAQLAAIGKKLPLPKVKGGKPQNVIVERSTDQADFIGVGVADEHGALHFPNGSLVWRAENLPKRAEKGADNMLKVMSDARKAALDMRLIDPAYGDTPGSKVHSAADNIRRIYDRWHAKRGTQLVFIDLSTPKKAKAKEEARIRDLMKRAAAGEEAAQEAIDRMSPDEFTALDGSFSVYDDLRDKLIARGIPADQIAFIHDANTDLQKEELFGKVRAGRVRVLFGSTAKMGAGTNVQNRLVALHHLDAPWRPSDLEQRDGRGIRQGNELYAEDPDGFEIEILRYATKNTLDARQWQTIEGKARFIGQVRKGVSSREIEDIAGEVANAAEMKAAASGNPLILEEMDLRQKVRRLQGQSAEHDREQHRIKMRIGDLRRERTANDDRLVDARKDKASAEDAVTAKPRIAGVDLDKPKDLGAAIISIGRQMKVDYQETRPIGSIGSFKLALEMGFRGKAFTLLINGAGEHPVNIDDIEEADATGLGMRVLNTVRRRLDEPALIEERNSEIEGQIPALERQIAAWPNAEQLAEAQKRHTAVLQELRPKQKPAAAPQTPPADAEASLAEDVPLRSLGLPKGVRVAYAFDKDEQIKAHADYRSAKAGDLAAAVRMIGDVAGALVEPARQFGADAIFVAPHAEEASGRNAIPQVLARFLAENAGANSDRDIVQASRAFHTGARPLDRLLGRPQFAGSVRKGGRYVLVDDVTVMGGTLAELANHIQTNGGVVAGIVTLVNASRSGIRPAAKQHVRTMEERYGDLIRQEFGIEPSALTGDESVVILAYRDANALRAGIAKAAQERSGRLRSKGFQASAAQELAGWDAVDGGPEQSTLTDSDRQAISDIVRDIGGLRNVEFWQRIALPKGAPAWGTSGPSSAGGFYSPGQDLIVVALNTGTRHVAYHEAFHRLQALYLTDQERKVLAAEKGRLRRIVASNEFRRGQAAKMEGKELEAEAFAMFSSGLGAKPHKAIRAVWEKIAAVARRVRNYLAGRGFQTAEDIFARARSGEIRKRAPQATPAGADRQFSIVTEGKVVEEVRGKLTDLQPHLLKAIPLNYFAELARPTMTAVGDYLRVKRLLDAYRGKRHAAADAVAQDWLKYVRLGFGRNSKAKATELAELMHDATLAGVDPSKTDAETRASVGYADLRARFTSISPAGRKLFADVRDAYRAQADELDAILLDNIRKAQEIAQRRAEAAYKEEVARIEKANLSPSARKDALADAAADYQVRKTRALWSMKARLTRMRIAFESSRVAEPYFPLARFGRYFVTARDVDGTVMSFSRREGAADRDRLAADMRRAFPTATVEVGVMESGGELRAAMDPRIVAEIETIVGGAGLDSDTTNTVLDQIWQRYLASMPDLSVRKRFIHRKGTAGFDADALRAFSSHMFHAAHQMGRLKYGMELQELVNDASEQARKSDDPTRGMTLANELRQRHKWVMNPTGGKLAQTMTSAAFVWYLGFTPAAAVVNMTQTPMLGIPILGGRFGSLSKAAAAILKASADTISGRGSIGRANLSADERRALEAFYESGLIDRTQSHDLAGVGETGVEYSPLRARVMALISWMFHNAEVWNREVTAIAAYRLARAAGQNTTDAIDTAHDLTWKTHFDYANSSRPSLLQNDFAKVALVFRAHNINMLYRLFRDVRQSFKGESAQARREARLQIVGVVGMMSLLAGVTGTIGFNLAMAIAGAVFGDDDEPMDFEQHFRKDVIDVLGPELGGVLLNGVPGHYLGIDLTNRIGMPDLWFRSPSRDLQGQDEFEYWVMNSLGASVSMLGDAFRGVELVREGDVARGVEVMAPKWVRDLMKSYRYVNEGLTNFAGDPMIEPEGMDTWNAISQALGFTPAKVAEAFERNTALKNAEGRVLEKRRALLNAFALATRSGDADARREALDAIKAFNRVAINKPLAITPETLQRSMAARQRNAKKREDGVLIQNERLGKKLREQLPERVYD